MQKRPSQVRRGADGDVGEAGRRIARVGSLAGRSEDLSSPQRHRFAWRRTPRLSFVEERKDATEVVEEEDGGRTDPKDGGGVGDHGAPGAPGVREALERG
jgi:hypothetical protein